MTPPVQLCAATPKDLSLIPGIQRWKERTKFHTLSSDRHSQSQTDRQTDR